ncbi:hypothetical protein DFS34DRAFT_688599 [Phlyctochytrium arcticum]|nr:hypothetical protein DFS34DRAFT_688599 [Phlyctochytrium arcticum]
MKTAFCDTNQCVWGEYLQWNDRHRSILEHMWSLSEDDWKELWTAIDKPLQFLDLYDYPDTVPKSFRTLDEAIQSVRTNYICSNQRELDDHKTKLLAFYEESEKHMLEHHPKPQATSSTTTTSDDDSSYEVVNSSSSDHGVPQDAPRAGQNGVAQSEMDTRLADLDKALIECNNRVEVVQQQAESDHEKTLLELQECKNEMQVMQRNAAIDIEQAVSECTTQMEVRLHKAAEDHEKAVLECKNKMAAEYEQALLECKKQRETIQKNLLANTEEARLEFRDEMGVMQKRAEDQEKALLEWKNQMEDMRKDAAADVEKAVLKCRDHEKALLEGKNQLELGQKNAAADHEARMQYKTQMDAIHKTLADSNKVLETEQSLMATRVAYLEQTLTERDERIASLEQSWRNHTMNSQTQQVNQLGIVKEAQHLATVAKEPTAIEFHCLFEKEHQHILAAMLQKLTPTERQFCAFLQWYEYHKVQGTSPSARTDLLSESQEILGGIHGGEEVQCPNVLLRGMLNELDSYNRWMEQDGSVDRQWCYVQMLYCAIRQRFRDWWVLYGKEITELDYQRSILYQTSATGQDLNSIFP